MLDLAGRVARDHRLFFIGETPQIHALGDCLLYQLEIDVEPADAATLTNEVVDLLIANDLDLGGLTFAFIGTKAKAASHVHRIR